MDILSFLSDVSKQNIAILLNEPMYKHTTFKIGGNADCFAEPKNSDELVFLLKSAKKYDVPVFLLGKGSNILVSDFGIEGVVISLLKLDGISVDDKTIICECGANLSSVCIAARQNELTGIEFAYGIPGSVGGALYMNAGAYGGDMSQVVKGAYCLNENFKEIYLDVSEMALSYRTSIFKSKMIILKVVIELSYGKSTEISEKMQDFLGRRKDKQPLEYPSAGSTFKRPEGNYAGTLIEKNGLKGASIGGAMVSRKHAGFIINYNNATAGDVTALIKKVQATVKAGDNISLEPEVIFIGRGTDCKS